MEENITFKITLVNKTDEIFYFNKVIPGYHISINKLELHPNDSQEITFHIPFDITLQAEIFLDKTSILIMNFLQIYTGSSTFAISLNDPSYKSTVTFRKRYQPQPKLLQISEVILEIMNKN